MLTDKKSQVFLQKFGEHVHYLAIFSYICYGEAEKELRILGRAFSQQQLLWLF